MAVLAAVLATVVMALWIGDPKEPGNALATVVGSELAFALAALVVLTATGTVGALPLGLPSPRQALGALLLGGGALLVSASTVARLYNLVDSREHTELLTRLFGELEAQIGVAGVLALTVALVPFCEELLFRGVIQRALASRFSPWAAIALAALLFGLVHGHPIHGLVAFVLGLAAGFSLAAAGTLLAPILVHAVNNAAATLAGLAAAPPEGGGVAVLPWWLVLPGLALLGLGVLCYSSSHEGSLRRRPPGPPAGRPDDRPFR
jgi:membrane protease YdiL (CAAX protease family)